MSEVHIRSMLSHGGARETEALARFRLAWDRGVRVWRDRRDGELIEILSLTVVCGVPCMRVRTIGREIGYTQRSSASWDPVEVS